MHDTSLTRYSAPGKYDHYPQGTLCRVITTLSCEYDLYKQVNVNDEDPEWHYVGTFSENIGS